jgi:hypothetical protein
LSFSITNFVVPDQENSRHIFWFFLRYIRAVPWFKDFDDGSEVRTQNKLLLLECWSKIKQSQ